MNQEDINRLRQQWEMEQMMIQSQQGQTMFNSEVDENLIRWQIETDKELERIERFLRKQVPKRDDKGHLYYEDPKEEDQLLNDKGVNEIMNLLSLYLSKMIILSNYREEVINQRCHEFWNRLTELIHNNYQDFGINTLEKMKYFPMIVMNVTNVVEAAYNRAWKGGERESLRTARQVHQQEPLGGMSLGNQKRFSLLKPTTWV